MSLGTLSAFYYGFEITEANKYIYFSESAVNKVATLTLGAYSLTDFLTEIGRAMNDAGDLTYTATIARQLRTLTITASGIFTLKTATGSGASAFSLMGFSGADRTGATNYAGNLPAGKSYNAQFPIQSYVPKEASKQAIDATINQSSDGAIVQVVKFGIAQYIEANLMYATSRGMAGSIIRDNDTGYEDLVDFMDFLITKAPVEFMEDEGDADNFVKVILDKTPDSDKGVGYRLKEMYDKNLPDFWQTGVLKFRVIQ